MHLKQLFYTWFNTYTYTHTTILLLCWNLSGTTRVSRYQKGKTRKGKTNLDLLEQETVSGSGICRAICKSAPHPRQPRQHPTTQFFYRLDALPAAQPTASKQLYLCILNVPKSTCSDTLPIQNCSHGSNSRSVKWSSTLYILNKSATLTAYCYQCYDCNSLTQASWWHIVQTVLLALLCQEGDGQASLACRYTANQRPLQRRQKQVTAAASKMMPKTSSFCAK